MRLVWVSFDVMGRDCLAAAAEAGAAVAAVVTLPGPIDPNRSGQCSFDELAADLGARLIETADVNSPETIAAIREVDPDLIFVVGWSQLVMDEFIGLPRHGVFGMHPTLLPRHRGRAAIPWAILGGPRKAGLSPLQIGGRNRRFRPDHRPGRAAHRSRRDRDDAVREGHGRAPRARPGVCPEAARRHRRARPAGHAPGERLAEADSRG